MKSKKIIYSLFTLLVMMLGVTFVKAANSATMSISGVSQANVDATFTQDIVVGNIGGANLNGAQGQISVSDPTCFSYVSMTKKAAGSSFNGTKFSYLNTDDGINTNTVIVTVTFKAGSSACTANIEIANTKLAFVDSTNIKPGTISKPISIVASTPAPTQSSDATLKSLSPSTGSLNTAFASGTTSYSMTVGNGTSSIGFTAVPNDSKASVQSGTTCSLSVGTNACKIVVKAEDGTTKTYTVNVTREAAATPTQSSDATLKSLSPSTGTLSPSFASGTTTYSLTAGDSVNTVTFTAVPNDSKATIVSGTTCSLSSGTTACKIVVKAENGTTKTYTVNVTKGNSGTSDPEPEPEPEPEGPKLSSDASLKSLTVPGIVFSPKFDKNVTTYSFGVTNRTTEMDFEAIPNDEKATVKIYNATDWKVGVNPVKIVVTAEDGSTKTYTVNVTRAGEDDPEGVKKVTDPDASNNYLKTLIVNNGELNPDFNKTTSNYTVTIGNQETELDLTAIAEASDSRVTIIGNDNLKVGVNTVTIEVTAKDGSLRVYTLNVTRSEKESDTKLKEIEIGGGYELDPKFSPDVYEYTVNVPSGVKELDVKAIAQGTNSKVEIVGNKDLKEGNNVVLLKVTDENGFTQYYRINVEKEASNKKFLGLTFKGWLLLLGILLTLGLLLFLLLLLLGKKKKEDTKNVNIKESQAPVIEFKPEFNFGSKNGTDDDIVHEGGVLNQYTGVLPEDAGKKSIPEATAKVKDDDYDDNYEEEEEIPYDPYDDIVTKDEIIDALEEARETDDDSKLKMLYAQELLNRKKEEIKAKDTKRKTTRTGTRSSSKSTTTRKRTRK